MNITKKQFRDKSYIDREIKRLIKLNSGLSFKSNKTSYLIVGIENLNRARSMITLETISKDKKLKLGDSIRVLRKPTQKSKTLVEFDSIILHIFRG